MPDQCLTGASRSELHTKFEQLPMLTGHIILNAFMAICREGFREEPCNWQSAFQSNFKERLTCQRGNYLSNNLGENAGSNKIDQHSLHLTRFSLITYIILRNDSLRNMYVPHSTSPHHFGSFPFCFCNSKCFAFEDKLLLTLPVNLCAIMNSSSNKFKIS
jgi:hypothetical protein